MKKMEKKISIGRYACYMGIVLVLLCGLTALLSSCESDLPGEVSAKGEPIELRFTLGDISYSEGKTEMRSDGVEPETVVVSLGDDLYLYATLESDPADRLRAAETIQPETRVMVVAYRSDGAYVGAAEYRVTSSGGSIVPATASGRGISVPAAGHYRFIAYSYNNKTSPPAYSSSPIAVALGNDLLWGETSGTVPVNEGVNTVSIGRLKHKFSRVKVKMSSSSTITAAAATLNPVYNGSLTLSSGRLDKGSAASPSTASFAFSTVGSTTVTSNPGLVFTKGDPFTVTLTSITVGNETKNNISITFTNTPLEEGKEYTLSLTLKTSIIFAASNIYWDGSKLTFDKGTPTDATMQKQGVFFKFGSLVGISPARTGSSNDFTASTVIYVPGYNSGSQTWSWSSATGWSWGSIPCFTGAPTGTGDRQDDSVIKSAYNSFANRQAYKGDICQLIDVNYRLPYSYEFGNGDIDSGWKIQGSWLWNGFDNSGSANCTADGKTLIDAQVRHDKAGYCFPGSGLRDEKGELKQVRYCSGYWSGSALTNTDAYNFFFMEGNFGGWMITDDPSNRQIGRPVRCVRK